MLNLLVIFQNSGATAGRAGSDAPAALCRGALPNRADLDRTDTRQRPAGRERNGLVGVLDGDEHIPAEVLVRLGEWAVRQESLAVPHANAGRRRRRVERVPVDVLTPSPQLFAGLHLPPVVLLALSQAALFPCL